MSTIPASLYMKRRGRRAGFTAGATMGVLGSLVCAAGVWFANFVILSLGTLLLGIYKERESSGRPLAQITRQPVFIVAVCGAIVGYGVMNLLMNATPIAMDMCGLSYDDTALVLQWHVIGMFAPSFVTGSLIARYGVLRIMGAGCALMLVCVTIGLAGTDLIHFWWALLLLGVGWNFLFVGGTTLLTDAYTPSEKAKTQGVNDFLVFFTTAMTSLASGALVTVTGWATLNQVALPLLALCAGALWWLSRSRSAAPT